ncbi:MAG: EpsG family protein [Treponema sp.]|nr:EpsG family protein [Treponema sp.]
MFFIVTVVLIYVAGFRYGLEADYWSYWRIFHEKSDIDIEIGYELISSFIRLFTHNFNYFLVCIAVLSLGIKSKVLAKMQYPFIALLILFLRYFVFFELNGMRQGLATAFILIAMYLLYRQKKAASFAVMCIATSIHLSSAAFLLAFIMKDYKWTPKKLLFCIVAILVFRLWLLVPLIETFSFLVGAGGTFVVKASKYLLANAVPSMSGMAVSVVRIIFPVLCVYFLGITEKNRFFFNIFIIGAFFNIAFIGLDTLSYRIAMVFYACEGIAVSQSIRRHNVKTLALVGIVIMLNFLSFYSGLAQSDTAIPYRNYLDENPATVKI